MQGQKRKKRQKNPNNEQFDILNYTTYRCFCGNAKEKCRSFIFSFRFCTIFLSFCTIQLEKWAEPGMELGRTPMVPSRCVLTGEAVCRSLQNVLRARIGVHGVQALHGFPIQRFASVKGAVSDVFQAVRECHVFQAGAFLEHAGRDFFHARGDRTPPDANAAGSWSGRRPLSPPGDGYGIRTCSP